MDKSMDIEKKMDIIKRNTEEILTEEDLLQLLKKKKKITAYCGLAPTGPLHLGHLVPLGKIFDFEEADISTKILIADIHAALDDLKAPWDTIKQRGDYYQKCLELALPLKRKPIFVRGSNFQLTKAYCYDVFRLSTITTVKRATRAASEVTRMKRPKVSELIYPIMQSLDEEYLKADIQFGGIDQRHILAYAREYLPRIGYAPRVEVMTPLVASLRGPGTKMSSSIPESIIKVYEPEEKIKEKIMAAFCPQGEIKDNLIIQLCQFIIFPAKKKIKIEREERFGGEVEFDSFEKLKTAYLKKEIHPADLKQAVSAELIQIFSKARDYFEKNMDILESLGKEFLP